MAVIRARAWFPVEPRHLYALLTDVGTLTQLWPEHARFKLLKGPSRLVEGSVIEARVTLLGQRFMWKTRIIEAREPEALVEEALESPFSRFAHERIVREEQGGSALYDTVKFRTALGPIGDFLLKRVLSSLLEYRNRALEALIRGAPRTLPSQREPLSLGLGAGLVMCSAAFGCGLLALRLSSGFEGAPRALLGLAAWLLLWFFSHDVAHVLAGYPLGVRFSGFYLGLSNLARALPLAAPYRLLFPALGVRIDRARSGASSRGLFAMYLAGPLASMLLPFFVALYLMSHGGNGVALVFVLLSSANAAVSAALSPPYGCIAKARRALRRP